MLAHNRTTKYLVSQRLLAGLLLIVFLVAPVSHTLNPNIVEAGPGGGQAVTIVRDMSPTSLKTMVESTLTTIGVNATALGVNSLVVKELMDGVSYAAAKVFLRAMVTSIINWINSGFKGSPAFVTDLNGFLSQVADETIGEFIYDDPALNFLCSPFQLDVKIALATQYNQSQSENYQPQCTLSNVVGNVDNFMQGGFSEGGWEGWFEMTQNPTNNPMGAYLSAQSEAYARIINEQGEEIAKLDFGNGFFSIEVCDTADKLSGAAPNCTIGTPGSVIANSINKALGAGQDELIAADEVNEVFNALFAQLAQKALSGTYGLLGMGGNSSYGDNTYGASGDRNYLEAIIEEDANTKLDTSFFAQTSPIQTAFKAETTYNDLLTKAITRVDDAEAHYHDTEAALASRSCSVGFAFPADLDTFRSDAKAKLTASLKVIAILNAFQDAFTNAASMADQQAVLEQFDQLNAKGIFRTEHENVDFELQLEYNLVVNIETLDADLKKAVNSC